MQVLSEFINSYFLWKDPMVVAVFSGAICGMLGVFIVLRRIVFVSAALTQISGFGVVLTFYLQSVFASSILTHLDPFIFSILITILAALFFSLKKDFHPISAEGVIGFAFLISSSLIIILSDKIVQGHHEIHNILFGSAVVVESREVLIIPLLTVIAFIINIFFYKDFVFVSYDHETAKLYNYPVTIINLIFFIVLAVILAVTTRALGALTVFSFLVLPALSAIYLSRSLKNIFFLSSIFGIISAALGYFFSFVFSIPTGATMAFTASIIFIVSFILSEMKKNDYLINI